MGQILNVTADQRVPYEEDSENGLLLGDKYIPEELITEILCYVDHKSLLNSQLVCKRWKMLMESYVWRKKAEIAMGCSLQLVKDVDWSIYYTVCAKKPFNRNLVKNHSGKDGTHKNWTVVKQGGDHWIVERPPVGVPPLPDDETMFSDRKECFTTSYGDCSKFQIIDLESEGLSSHILDTFQPPIVVSEWYSCRWDCPATYELEVVLEGKNNKRLQNFEFRRKIEEDNQNQWHHVSKQFTNYGPGLKTIRFSHSGKDNLFWAGHYGSKMAGASVIIKLPNTQHDSPKTLKWSKRN